MAEYAEVNKQFKRMCSIYQSKRCSGCPMQRVNISQCRRKAFESPGEFEITVMQWAKQNPEPVYPTWAEWLNSIGVAISDKPFHAPSTLICVYQVDVKMFKPIPAEYAEKLGIKPINREHT